MVHVFFARSRCRSRSRSHAPVVRRRATTPVVVVSPARRKRSRPIVLDRTRVDERRRGGVPRRGLEKTFGVAHVSQPISSRGARRRRSPITENEPRLASRDPLPHSRAPRGHASTRTTFARARTRRTRLLPRAFGSVFVATLARAARLADLEESASRGARSRRSLCLREANVSASSPRPRHGSVHGQGGFRA